MCITDSRGSCKLSKHIILEIIEVRCLQWEPILSNVSCQQKTPANSMENMQAAAEAGQGKGGGRW